MSSPMASEAVSADALPLPSLSVVLSFANEEEVLPEAIRRLRHVLTEECRKGTLRRYELILVNDASTDRSLEVLMEAAQGHDDIRIINMSRNFGVTPCVLAGMDYCSGDLVVYLDVDLQDPPEVIPEMLRAWREAGGVDVVHTIRRSRAGESWLKRVITRVGYWILGYVATVTIRMEAGDFKLFSRRVVNELRRLREKKPFMRGLVAWVGFKQTEIYYHRQPRQAGKTKFPVYGAKVIRNFLASALISFSDIPLQLATVTGVLISLLAFGLLIYVVAGEVMGYNLPGWSALMVTMLFLGGVQMLFLGVLGLYVSSIFLEAKDRPNYIVENTYGFPQDVKAGPPAPARESAPRHD